MATATIEYWQQVENQWHGDGTYASPCCRKRGDVGYKVRAFGRWWIVKNRPTPRHLHRVYIDR